MKFVGLASILLLFAAVAAYGFKLQGEVKELALPEPSFYEHFAMIQVRARMQPLDSMEAGPQVRLRKTGAPRAVAISGSNWGNRDGRSF